MAFLNDLGKKVSITAQEVAKKTKESSEISRQERLIAAEKRQIDAICLQIGKLYYELHADSYEDSFESLVKQIISCEARIEEYVVEIDRVKNIKKCPQCKNEIPFSAVFCNFCGCNMAQAPTEDDEVTEILKCASCGFENNSGSTFCENCGANLLAEKQDNVVVKCKNCGEDVGDSAFCPNCGTKVE